MEEDIRCILSIDGGGFRGIIPAKILSEIERRVTEEIKKDHKNVDIRCADLFDIISGTSTGSILALGLSIPKDNRPKFDAQYLVDFYKTHGHEVFPEYSAIMFANMLLAKSKKLLQDYAENEAEEVEERIKKIESKTNNEGKKVGILERLFSISMKKKNKSNETEKKKLDVTINKTEVVTISKAEDVPDDIKKSKAEDLIMSKDEKKGEEYFTKALMYIKGYENAYNPWKPKYEPDVLEKLLQENFQDIKLKDTVNNVGVIIPSFNITNSEGTFFTNLYAQYEDYLMRDVIQASASAPTYFPAKQIGTKYFIDGGVFQNNPTVIAYLEAKKKFPNAKFVVVSLGTGYFKTPLEMYKDSGVVQWVKPLIDILFNAELDNDDATMKFLAEFDGTSYYRIQPQLSMEDYSISNTSTKETDRLIAFGDEIIKNPNYKLDEIINLLVEKCRKKMIFPTKTKSKAEK
ncbi:3238_t:CDS:1 [Scutellospora calospora]|uniref:3238_t:CDS:1 n=1 Tax=Scutellospora calospora TaxID=85575 RepID=A0ACA9KX81_9GLOM|nr:3238_t:CDS:1 [Scutellospora calospora]